jgi:hypothetical protein
MYKDQVYLIGAVEILKKRNELDFVKLYSGKLNLEDLARLDKEGTIETKNLNLPYFLHD